MERIEGPSMVTVLGRRPWTLRQQGALLADLHQRLHEIPAPPWLTDAPCGQGDRLVHLDLHPLNVLLARTGPVVIDWPNAVRGDGNTDVALTWVLIAGGGIPGGGLKAALMGQGRSVLSGAFLKPFDLPAVEAQLADVVAWKATDPHMSAVELAAMRNLAQRHS
jgi:Ser/Thr protein kinase RdoA (MazF antagonist)